LAFWAAQAVFFKFLWAKKFKIFFNILATALKSYIKWLLYLFFLKKLKKVEKIGYHSNFNFECNTKWGFKEPAVQFFCPVA
jgi:hypothetical protein